MFDASEIAKQCNDVYISSENTVVLDSDNCALRHFLTHMHESLAQSLKIECERVISEFKHNSQSIIDRHIQDINDYINSNICDIIKDKI